MPEIITYLASFSGFPVNATSVKPSGTVYGSNCSPLLSLAMKLYFSAPEISFVYLTVPADSSVVISAAVVA